MNILRLLIAYFIPLLIGLTMVSLAEGRRNIFRKGEKLADGFALGLGIQTMYIFCLGLINIRFTFWSCSAPVWPAVLVNLYWIKTGRISLRPGSLTILRGHHVFGKILVGIIILLISIKLLLNIFISFSSPAYFDDSITIWDYKAKVFYHHRGLVKDPEHPDFFGGNVPKYPNGIPLFKTWLAICNGQWEEWPVNTISWVIYLLTGVFLYYGLKRWHSALTALIGAYLAMSLPLFAFHGAFAHSDIIVGFYLMGGVIYLYRWLVERDSGLILVAAGFFAVVGWIKDEGVILFLGGVLPTGILYLLLHRSWNCLKSGLILIVTVLLFLSPWLVSEIVYRFPVAVSGSHYFKLEFHPEAIMIIKRFFFNTGNYNIFWLLYLVSLIIVLKIWQKVNIAYLVLMNLLALCTAIVPFVFTPFFKWLAVGTTINRAMLMIIPAAIFTICRIWGLWLQENSIQKNNLEKQR